ncbi:MAG: ABC-2 type transport system ATP-binding protein [Luteibaculaceae bacterium]|jgi:ABC-2 type transport system ATP-binding protein
MLEIVNVNKQYASHQALKDVSLEIKGNRIFGLLGPNGAGKTSLIRIINQITYQDSGSILFWGEELERKHIADIGYLPEERGLYKKMKVGEQAMYFAQLRGMKNADIKKELKYWFERFEISGWWDKKVEELSKGMAQKIQFITTILHQPKLLILDEPFSGFDPINANLVKEALMGLKEKGTSIILSTHNMESVEEICDDMALIHQGEVLLRGEVNQIKQDHAKGLFRVKFKGSLMKFTLALGAKFKLIDSIEKGEANEVLIQLLGDSTRNELLNAVMGEVQIDWFGQEIPSINDIFISTVKE